MSVPLIPGAGPALCDVAEKFMIEPDAGAFNLQLFDAVDSACVLLL
jgi:hypothetical protein